MESSKPPFQSRHFHHEIKIKGNTRAMVKLTSKDQELYVNQGKVDIDMQCRVEKNGLQLKFYRKGRLIYDGTCSNLEHILELAKAMQAAKQFICLSPESPTTTEQAEALAFLQEFLQAAS